VEPFLSGGGASESLLSFAVAFAFRILSEDIFYFSKKKFFFGLKKTKHFFQDVEKLFIYFFQEISSRILFSIKRNVN
jgi:hypothetical protein